jgi:hypothetical protein
VDQSLEQDGKIGPQTISACFNPYFSGSVTGTENGQIFYDISAGFNPYFSGSVTGT